MSRGRWRLAAALLVPGLLVPLNASGQCARSELGTVGVGLYHCVGGVCWISEDPANRFLQFGTEPLLRDLTLAGRSAGLAEKDVLVAVDGVPITVPEAGRRLANLEAGDRVRLMVRREGELRELEITASAGCSIGGLAVTPDTASPSLSLGPDATPEPPGGAYRPETAGRLEGIDPSATGTLGIGVSCGRCGWIDEGRARLSWRAADPLEVIFVDDPGPGRAAGLEVGDMITHVDGVSVTTPAGAELLSSITSGTTYELRVRRAGATLRVAVVAARMGREPR